MQKKIKEIVKEIAEKHNISEEEVEKIVNSQFLFVRRVIESAERDKEETFKTIKLPHFGKFVLKKNMLKYITENKKKKEENGH